MGRLEGNDHLLGLMEITPNGRILTAAFAGTMGYRFGHMLQAFEGEQQVMCVEGVKWRRC